MGPGSMNFDVVGNMGTRRRGPGWTSAAVTTELPDDAWVYPGHGKDTTLGAERPHLAEWRERGWW